MKLMKNRCAHAAIALALGASGIALATQPATAAQVETKIQAKVAKNVVTKSEFKRVKKGMPIEKVHKIFGTKGKQSYFIGGIPSLDIPAEQMRDYKTANRYGTVSITFAKVGGGWKLDSKMAFWGF